MAKDKIINFKIEEEVLEEFKTLCEENFTTPSHELRLFVRQYLNRNKGSKVLLSDLHKNR